MPASPPSSAIRRVPLFGDAAFFVRASNLPGVPAAFARAVLGLFAAFALLAAAPVATRAEPVGHATKTPRTPPPPATIKLAGVSYTDARAWFARLGYKAAYDADKRVLTLSSATGKITLTADSREASLHGIRIFLGEPALVRRGALHVASIDLDRFIHPILRPNQLPPRALRTIVLDPGHGGNDSGTQNKTHKLSEKGFTLDVAQRVQRLLADSGWRVLLTRTDDRFIALPARAEFANKAGADLFVSIHFNAVANNPAVRGTETYVLTPRFQRSTSSPLPTPDDKLDQPGNRHDHWSAVLGAQMHRQLLGKLRTEDRGYKRARFAVLRLVDCPAVLVEAGYLSNDAEARKIATEAYRGDIAEALAAAIHAYAASLGSASR